LVFSRVPRIPLIYILNALIIAALKANKYVIFAARLAKLAHVKYHIFKKT